MSKPDEGTRFAFIVLPEIGDLPPFILAGTLPKSPAYRTLIDRIREGNCKPRKAGALAASIYVWLLRVRRIVLVRHPSLPAIDRICIELQKLVFRAFRLTFAVSQSTRRVAAFAMRRMGMFRRAGGGVK